MKQIADLKEHLIDSIKSYLLDVKKCKLDTNFEPLIGKENDIGIRRAMAYLNAIRLTKGDYETLLTATAILLGKGQNLKQYIGKTILEFYKDLNSLNSSYIDVFGVNPEYVIDMLLKNKLVAISKSDKEDVHKIEQFISENKASARFFKTDYKYKISDLTNQINEFINSKKVNYDDILSSKPSI